MPPKSAQTFSEAGQLPASVRHILISGPSGAGKSTLARRLSEELGLPRVSVDQDPQFKELSKTTGQYVSSDPQHQPALREIALRALAAESPSVIDGFQLAYLRPDDMTGHRRILVDPGLRALVRRRLKRDRNRARRKGVSRGGYTLEQLAPGSPGARDRAAKAKALAATMAAALAQYSEGAEKVAQTFSEGEIIDYFLQHHKKPGNPGRSHADLRLGRPGEPLQSWAIPKERLPEVGEKLLAPETEPHAYGYGRFSGKFGKGRNASEVSLLEAGQGTVGGVKDGIFTFSIKNGDKTRKFALVRIKGRKKWLVIGQNPEKTPVVAADSEKTAADMVKTVEVPMKLVSSTKDPKADVCVEVADTPEKRSEGLSKRAELPEGRGMFFDTPGPFWMKDVNMPLDVIFMSKSGSVLDFCTMEAEDPCIETSKPVDKSASTCKQKPLKLYKSASPEATYAIEVPAGWSKRHNVQPGDKFETA